MATSDHPDQPSREGALVLLIHRRTVLRVLTLAALYSTVIVLAYACGFLVRFEFSVPADQWRFLLRILGPIVLGQLGLLAVFGQFGTLLSYFSMPDAQRIGKAVFFHALLLLVFWYATGGAHAPPRSVILMGFILTSVGLIALRVAFRRFRESPLTLRGGIASQKACIVGAGEAGAHLAKEMMMKPHLRMIPVAFFDDDLSKQGSRLHGIPILGAPEKISECRLTMDKAIIAMPTAPAKRIREVLHVLSAHGLKSEIIPSLDQLVSGSVKISQIRPVEIEDLLGRPPVDLQTDRIRELIEGQVIMVTGAGGTIGGELCRQIASHGPRELLLVERSESLLFQTDQELRRSGYGSEIIPLVADLMDESRMEGIFTRFSPRVVFHAAAHKHVPMMEHQPAEAFRNNTLGTRQLAELASRHGVGRFVFISTDKAINPTNVMGATKRMAELYLQAMQKQGASGTRFLAVRFGNVLGSSGSVIPTFKRQIAEGGPVTVTHPDVTRYFMTVKEAAGLVLQSATLGEGGEIFVLDMGRPMKIVDVARQLIELSGLQAEIDIEIKFVGLRPGEKLFEELNHNTENHVPTGHPRIMRFLGAPPSLAEFAAELAALQAKSSGLDADGMKLAIKKLVPEYQPYLGAS